MTVTVPYSLPDGKSSDDLRVFCIKNGECASTGSDADGHTPVPEGGDDPAPDAPAEEPPQTE